MKIVMSLQTTVEAGEHLKILNFVTFSDGSCQNSWGDQADFGKWLSSAEATSL